MNIFSRILRERSVLTVSYVAINYATFLLGIIAYLLYVKSLTPVDIGLIAISRTWGQVFDYLHLGARFSVDRYSPITSKSFSTSVFLIALILTFLIGLNLLIILYFVKQDEVVFYSIIASSFVLALSNCYKAHFRALGKVQDLLLNGLFLQFLPLAVNLAAFYMWPDIKTLKLYGIPYIVSFGFSLVYYRKELVLARPLFKMILAGKRIYKHAISQFLYAAITLLNMTADRFYVEYMLGRESLGVYSVQLFVYGALSFLPATLCELKIREIMRSYNATPSLPSSGVILFIAGPTIVAIIVSIVVLGFASDYYPIININPLGFYISAVCVVPVIFTSIYSQTISASRSHHLLAPVGILTLILNLTFISNYELFGNQFTIAGPLIKFLVGAIEALLLFCFAKLIIKTVSENDSKQSCTK